MAHADGSVASALAAWRDIKQAANAAVITHGGTITHHHAVGRDHRSGYEREADPLFRAHAGQRQARRWTRRR
jgi:alkyldihydroxyacetonephosphate synthase